MACRTLLGLVLALSLCGSGALATLGGQEGSISQDTKTFKCHNYSVSSQTNYKVHTLTTDIGAVREFVSGNGTIFGVAWEGSGQPDLSNLFGTYFQEYHQSNTSSVRPRGRGTRVVKSANITVEHSGHMGSIRGRAFINALIPAGVSPEVIK